MKAKQATKILDQTIAFTTSSLALKNPYRPDGNLVYKLKNKIQTFFLLRSFETEFIDFRSYNVNIQFKEIYDEIYNAYRRSDKVGIERHCSEGMKNVSMLCLLIIYYLQYCKNLLN